jgi:hypothetical protein
VQQRSIGIVLIVVGLGVAAWLGVGLATGRQAGGVVLGFVLFSLPFLAVGLYFLLQAKGEIKQQSEADKERAVLDAVTTRGRVSIPDLAIDTDSSRDDVRRYVYDLIGKGLFAGYVNWDKGELVSAEAAQIKEDTCPNCGGKVELAGKGLVRCPYCGTETYLSGPTSPSPGSAPAAPAPESPPTSPLPPGV